MTARAPEPDDVLTDALERADTDWGEQAATRLLAAHRAWLHRSELLHHVTVHTRPDGALTAWIDWPALTAEADHCPASSGELATLRLACHLAGELPEYPDPRWALSEILNCLDTPTTLLATRAIAAAALGPDNVGPLR